MGAKGRVGISSGRVQGWEAVSPMVNGQYNSRIFSDSKYGVNNTRPNFSWITLWIRFQSLLLNRGGDVELDRAWLRNAAESVGAAFSPDGGKTYGLVLHVKAPHAATFLRLVEKNHCFIEAYESGRRPLVAFNNVTFAYSKYAQAMELQTLHTQRGNMVPDTVITWVGNYGDLPKDYAARVAAQFVGEGGVDGAGETEVDASSGSDSDSETESEGGEEQ